MLCEHRHASLEHLLSITNINPTQSPTTPPTVRHPARESRPAPPTQCPANLMFLPLPLMAALPGGKLTECRLPGVLGELAQVSACRTSELT